MELKLNHAETNYLRLFTLEFFASRNCYMYMNM